MSVTSSRPR